MELIVIGVIANTFGIKGEVKIKSYSDFDEERYRQNNTVYIEYNNEYVPLIVNSFRIHKGMSIVSFKEHLNINLIEKYKGCNVCYEKSKIKPLKKGEYYRFEIIGLDVYDDKDNYLGKVKQIEETLANANLRIQRDDGKSFLVPYIKQFILNIDKDNNKIKINVIEGLLWKLQF